MHVSFTRGVPKGACQLRSHDLAGPGSGQSCLKLLVELRVLEAFSPGVEKRLCRFFESKNFGVCNAFLHTKRADQVETWHSKNALSTPGLNASSTASTMVALPKPSEKKLYHTCAMPPTRQSNHVPPVNMIR